MVNDKHLLKPMYLKGGAIAIGHRLKRKVLEDVQAQGVTHIVTLLSDKEGAQQIKKDVEITGMKWVDMGLENAQPPASDKIPAIRSALSSLQVLLEEGQYLYLHCSAGIHRTGMITYALFRYMGYTVAESFIRLSELRELSAQEVGFERLRWGDQFAPTPVPLDKYGIISLDEFLVHNVLGCIIYAHSIGEGYQYRGKIDQVFPDGGLGICQVETTANWECDFDFSNPYSINGDWQTDENFEYRSDRISIEREKKGFIINYSHAGTVYLHYPAQE